MPWYKRRSSTQLSNNLGARKGGELEEHEKKENQRHSPPSPTLARLSKATSMTSSLKSRNSDRTSGSSTSHRWLHIPRRRGTNENPPVSAVFEDQEPHSSGRESPSPAEGGSRGGSLALPTGPPRFRNQLPEGTLPLQGERPRARSGQPALHSVVPPPRSNNESHYRRQPAEHSRPRPTRIFTPTAGGSIPPGELDGKVDEYTRKHPAFF